MHKLATNVLWETRYPGVQLGAVVAGDEVMMIDSPLRVEDVRDWLGQVNELGRPKYAVLLDSHPDRVLGARNLEVPLLAQEHTAETVSRWPDTFKGASNPIGAEADRIKRLTGVSNAVPEVIFGQHMLVQLNGRFVELQHHPGATPGALWVVLAEEAIVFVGDAVTVSEPAYIGNADVEAWLHSLDVLREAPYSDYKYIASRDGVVSRDDINDMARFLRKIPVRLERMQQRQDPEQAARTIAAELIDDFKVPKGRREPCLLRLEKGLWHLYRRQNPGKD